MLAAGATERVSVSRRSNGIEPPLFDEFFFGIENPQHAVLFS
jgi:hypothetical protein